MTNKQALIGSVKYLHRQYMNVGINEACRSPRMYLENTGTPLGPSVSQYSI